MSRLFIIGSGGFYKEIRTYLDDFILTNTYITPIVVDIDLESKMLIDVNNVSNTYNISNINSIEDKIILAVGEVPLRQGIVRIFEKFFEDYELDLLFPNFYFTNFIPNTIQSTIGRGNVFLS